MSNLNVPRTRDLLQAFDFATLFVEELGWQRAAIRRSEAVEANGNRYQARQIAHLGGAAVFEVLADDGAIPDAKQRAAVQRQVAKLHHENLLIFVDRDKTQSLWYWVKREGTREHPRDHFYVKGQPGDLFLSKLAGLVVEITDYDPSGNISIAQAANRLKAALDVERVTKRFFNDFQQQHVEFLGLIEGIADERARRWYASVLLNRLMFIYFLQGKRFLNGGDAHYLQHKLQESQGRGPNRFYSEFLRALFFEGFAKPERERDPQAAQLVGTVPYLNGSLFLPHAIEQDQANRIRIPDVAFENLLKLFTSYSWNLNDTPGGNDNEINPDVLGYIFEKYINQKSFGAYYTRPEITEYLCEQTIHRLVLDRVEERTGRRFATMADLLMALDARLCGELWANVLPSLSLLDPACGSGAFLVAAMKTLLNIYGAVKGRMEVLNDHTLNQELKRISQHPSFLYFIKKRIISDNLFGVDLMPEATEIAKVRLFLALVASAERVDDLEPLPNVDFNLLAGNSLIGLLKLDDMQLRKQTSLFDMGFRDELAKKNHLVDLYRNTTSDFHAAELTSMRDEIETLRGKAQPVLNEVLLDDFRILKIQYEEATWDAANAKEGKPRKRPLTRRDVDDLRPFHWAYEFDRVLDERGGFDAIITNPPWDIFKPNAKEFFMEHSDLVTKKKMTIKEFETAQGTLLRQADVRAAWLQYQSRFPYLSSYYRGTPQYANQIGRVNGKKVGSDTNLYKLFLEQCYNLLRPGGLCGIVIPSGIYTDLGAKQLREMLFGETQVTGLFGFENRKEIFEGVHRSYKFVVLTFRKGGTTASFPAAFMRHHVSELKQFPREGGLEMSVELIQRLSPDSLSVMEFGSERDVEIAEKMAQFPLLGEELEGTWNLSLTAEFHMTSDSKLFKTQPGPDRLPLYEGKLIHQFTHLWGEPRYWVDEREGRKALLRREQEEGQLLDYQSYRLGVRAIARNTDSRTLIAGPLPRNLYCGNSILVVDKVGKVTDAETLAIQGLLNSFVVDFTLRQKVSANVNMFYIYQLPVPRLQEGDRYFAPIVERAARLICTTPEFDDLARAAGLRGHEDGATDAAERGRLRADLDGMVAHLYGLTEAEFAHVLATFPLVDGATKAAALDAYGALAPLPGDEAIARLIQGGETEQVEFKEAARWNHYKGQRDSSMADNIIKAVAGLLNGAGGTLLIGVRDDGSVLGVEQDMQELPNRDKYELFLRDILDRAYGRDVSAFYRVSFHPVDGKTVCRVTVQPAPDVVYTAQGQLYVRTGNRTQAFTPQEAVRYIARRNADEGR